ncbi:MAG TPA: hypothetical protein VE403_03690 [Sphingomicrobium sp.]|nr:hypothetical protein [Sphingomicrobium sp.]
MPTARRLLALSLLLASSPCAAADLDLFSAETLSLSGNVRLSATSGEESWVDGGYGKLGTSGGGDGFRFKPQIGEINLAWQPRFSWSLSATVVGTLQGGERPEAGLEQAYVSFRPMRGERHRISARAGLLWPSVSLEHEGADWHVRDTITPSAINSWIGEEVRPLAAEITASTFAGEHQLSATAAVFAANDTSGTLLAIRGWALHDRTTLAFRRQPLPPLEEEYRDYQAPFTHPLLDVGPGFAKRPGYYAKLSWQPPVPVRFELFRYDNRADPEAVNAEIEWGWRTHFNHAGAIAKLGASTELKVQALAGRTRMGMVEDDRRWFDTRFRSAFAMLTQAVGKFGLAGRIDAFDVRNHGSLWDDEYDDTGWAATVAGKREWTPFTGVIELAHVSSKREDRHEHLGLAARQRQTSLQAELRLHW